VGIHRCTDPSGTRRGHDGAGGAARGAARYGKAGSFAIDRLYHVAWADGSHIGPARWWFHYNLRFVALDLLPECPLELLGVFLAHWLIPDFRSSLFRIAFALVGTIALLSVIDSFSLAPNTGAELSGHRFTRGPLPADSSRHASSSDAAAPPATSKSGHRVATLEA
jgi:hypothetical protein